MRRPMRRGWTLIGPAAASPDKTSPSTTRNSRWQSQMKKHNLRVNIVYVDGHSALQRPSRICWGQFYAKYDGNVRNNVPWSSPASNAALDAADIAPDM